MFAERIFSHKLDTERVFFVCVCVVVVICTFFELVWQLSVTSVAFQPKCNFRHLLFSFLLLFIVYAYCDKQHQLVVNTNPLNDIIPMDTDFRLQLKTYPTLCLNNNNKIADKRSFFTWIACFIELAYRKLSFWTFCSYLYLAVIMTSEFKHNEKFIF